MCTVGPKRFVRFLATFNQANAGVRVSVRELMLERLTQSLFAGEVDVALMVKPLQETERLSLCPLYEERFMVACAPSHRFEEKAAVPIAEIAGEAYLTRANCEQAGVVSAIMRERMIHVREVFRSEREDWIQSMVLAGMGICFVPQYTPVVPGIVTRPVVDPEIKRSVHVATVVGRTVSPEVGCFLRAVQEFEWSAASR